MAIQGLRNTGITGGGTGSNDFVAGQRPLNWREGILLLYPNGRAPLLALTAAMKSKVTDDPEFNWWEKPLDAQRVALNAAITATGTTFTVVAGGKALPVNALLWSEQTQEVVQVTAIGSDTSITVIRAFTGDKVNGTAITYNAAGINPFWTCIGTAFKEGSLAPDGLNFDPVKRNNYTQIFRNNLEMTRTAMKTRLRTGDQVREAKRECLEYHSVEMEKGFFLGKKSEAATGGVPIRTTSGCLEWITTNAPNNVVDYAATPLTMTLLENEMRLAFAFGSSEKMAFMGNRAIMLMQQVIRLGTGLNWTVNTSVKEFGMNVSRLITPFGELVMKTHPLFNQLTGGTTGGTPYRGLESWMFILDMDNLQYRYLSDSDTKYEADQKTPGQDGMKSGYITECGLEINHAATHYVIKNLSTVIAG